MSAATGRGVEKLLPESLAPVRCLEHPAVPTAGLNRWLADVIERHPPPLAQGRRVKIRYVTQVKARPPTFVLFTNRPEELPVSYMRYLANDLREAFNMPGIPLLSAHPQGPQSVRGKRLASIYAKNWVGDWICRNTPTMRSDRAMTSGRSVFVFLVETQAFFPLGEKVARTVRRRLLAGQRADGPFVVRMQFRAGRPAARSLSHGKTPAT